MGRGGGGRVKAVGLKWHVYGISIKQLGKLDDYILTDVVRTHSPLLKTTNTKSIPQTSYVLMHIGSDDDSGNGKQKKCSLNHDQNNNINISYNLLNRMIK